MLDPHSVRRRFERAAATFDTADFVHAATRDGLFERLDGLTINADTVLDLGAATGSAMPLLNKRFSRPHVIELDVAANMLGAAKRKRGWFVKASFLQADARAIPVADASIDVVFCNLLLPFMDDPGALFSEVARVLRKEGLFVFATLGPDSLAEISQAWSQVDDKPHVHRFLDMHDLGDGLIRAGLGDPILDVDRLLVRYSSSARLFADLKAVGARNSLQARARGLTGRRRFQQMTSALEVGATGHGFSLDLELVYGHCWGAGTARKQTQWGIDADAIPIRRKTS